MKFRNICLSAIFFLILFSNSGFARASEKEYLLETLPSAWQSDQDYFDSSPAIDRWWECFNDTILTRLINLAVKNNFNIEASLKNMQMAQKVIGQARASYFPVLSASAGWTRTREAGAIRGESFTSSYFSLGASVSWEIDVFGRVYESVKEKKAAFEVSKADYDAVILSLCANLATSYIELRMYQEELRVAKEHIESQQYVCKITESRFNAQLASMLDVTQAKIVLYETESTLPSLEANVKNMKNAIALLVGVYPDVIADLLESEAPMPEIYHTVAAGIPADLLRRRPDIMEAEASLTEYAAAVGVAKRDFLPSLAITGDIGTYSNDVKGLFGKNSLGYSIAPQLSWTIFEGLSRNYALAEAKLQLEAAVDSYNLTVMTAVEEVNNAMNNYAAYVESVELQKRVVEQSKKSLDLSFELYRSGLTMFTNVVDSEIDWLTSQNTLISMQASALESLIDIYRSLGGGWEVFVPSK